MHLFPPVSISGIHFLPASLRPQNAALLSFSPSPPHGPAPAHIQGPTGAMRDQQDPEDL